jgi:integrase
VLEPILKATGARRLRELSAADVHQALSKMAAGYSSAAVAMGHNALTRAIRHAESRDLVGRNVATLVDTPKGRGGRPSRSLSLGQTTALLRASEAGTGPPESHPRPASLMHAYIVLCLLTGIRTEEARALRWEHVDLDGVPDADPPGLPHVAIWRSVRADGDTKTKKSRRTLALAQAVVGALRRWQLDQTGERLAAGTRWHDNGLVFTTSTGTALDAGNVRKMFRRITKAAGIGENWTPRELRHSFVSVMSDRGIATEEISRLVGHSSTRVTETVYRHELRPVLARGAEVMDEIFKS